MAEKLQAPFPWFGGKSRVADLVWQRFGDVPNYIEPFAGSLAVLLGRPHEPHTETVNDIDGYLCNFWRAAKHDPEQVAHYADWPVNENDLHARHIWLVNQKQDFVPRIEGDPEFYDAKIAGWWVWGISAWIGGGWCDGQGPWRVVDGKLDRGGAGRGVKRSRPQLGNAGNGVHRKRPQLSHAGNGVHRKPDRAGALSDWMRKLAHRLRRVRVVCGDWSRVSGHSVTTNHGLTAVFLDPPYSAEAGRDNNIYTHEDLTVAHAVREWAIDNGDNADFRIALCGYDNEHAMPHKWECVAWKAHGGLGNQKHGGRSDNHARERIWFSPHCLKTDTGLFGGGT